MRLRLFFIRTRRMAATKILSSVFCLLSSALCYAEDLPDPTRPPFELGVAADGRGVAAASSSGLQSVIIYPDRRTAIINGQVMQLGVNYSGGTLVEVSERSAVLQGNRGRRELSLFPGVKLKMKAEEPPEQAIAVERAVQKETEKKPDSEALEHAVPKEEK